MATAEVRAHVQSVYAPVGEAAGIPEMRTAFDNVMREPDNDVVIKPASIGGVEGLWISTPEGGDNTVLHIHGGAFMLGSAHGYRFLASEIARAARARVFVPDYGLAPENVFPLAFEEIVAVYRGLLAAGTDPRRTLISGDSAGGNLALAAVMELRDSGDQLPAGVALLSPFADLNLSSNSFETAAALDPISSREAAEQGIALYLNGADPNDNRASAMFSDFKDWPPLLVQIGTSEILLDDSVRIAESARAAGVDVDLQVSYGMIHVFQMFPDKFEQARTAIDEIGKFAQRVTS